MIRRVAALSALMLVLSACSQKAPKLTADSAFKHQVTLVPTDRPSTIHFTRVTPLCPRDSKDFGCASLRAGRPANAFVTSQERFVFFDRYNGLIEMDSAGHYV